MTVRQQAQGQTQHRDPVRDDARAAAVETLASHQGIIRSLSVEQRRLIVALDPGPSHEVGRDPRRR